MRTPFSLLFLFLPLALQAQFTYVLDQSIPVKDTDGAELSAAWTGGLNAAQYNTMDLNADGKEDLVLFDRMANKVITFLNHDNQYRYSPQYEIFFPAGITNWMLLRDHNCDGKKDIFTADILGIKVYTNTTQPGSELTWKQFLFFSGFPGPKSQVLLTKGFSGKINLQMQSDDLPAISDADGDGDLDIFNMRFVGDGTVEFHKNFSKERYGTCDSLDFERITQRWGDVEECSCGTFAFNSAECPPDGGRTKHSGGKGLLALDANGDLQTDLVFSEASCARLYLFQNQGTLMSPVINSASSFPAPQVVNFLIFPAAYYEDVDFDGKNDLISTPNIVTKEYLNTNLRQSNWMYKNTGTNASPTFSFVKNNFLQDRMIDVGDNAVPAFADLDGDGDDDMLISRNSSANFSSTIFVFENKGTAAAPTFELLSDDYLNFSFNQFYNMKIQIADINSDSKPDLVFTAANFQTGLTDIYYIANKAADHFDLSGEIETVDFQLTYPENLHIVDINQDGLPDVLAGRSNGSIQYWKNEGQPGAPAFVLEDADYLQIGTSVLRQNISCHTADLDADGKADLIMGDQTGKLKIVSDFRNKTDASDAYTEIVFNPLTNIYDEHNLGGRVWPAVVNLFNATKPAIVAGSILGGVQVLRNDEGESLPPEPVVDIYPNPVERSHVLNVRIDRAATVEIVSVLGQRLSDPIKLRANEINQYQLPFLTAGYYLLKFTVNRKSFTKRLALY
ncbi:MAG: T9SS type A sorting domain-containing protein [Bacteroidota bacterium]